MASCATGTALHRSYDALETASTEVDLVLIGRQERTVPEWARHSLSGLEVGARGGIAVNQEMMASSKVCIYTICILSICTASNLKVQNHFYCGHKHACSFSICDYMCASAEAAASCSARLCYHLDFSCNKYMAHAYISTVCFLAFKCVHCLIVHVCSVTIHGRYTQLVMQCLSHILYLAELSAAAR
jgi:hypothetical protein